MNVYTNDGKLHLIFNNTDIISLIREYMGEDTYQYIVEHFIKCIDEQSQEIRVLETEAEYTYEDNRDRLLDIRDMVDEARDMLDAYRLDKKKLRAKLTDIYDKSMETI